MWRSILKAPPVTVARRRVFSFAVRGPVESPVTYRLDKPKRGCLGIDYRALGGCFPSLLRLLAPLFVLVTCEAGIVFLPSRFFFSMAIVDLL